MPSVDDTYFMKEALKLAIKGQGHTSPNPMVGAVCVKRGSIIGRGYHKKSGLPHAEIEAFSDAQRKGNSLKGASLYVTLEPCCHKEKRTPPCADAIISAEISEVIVGAIDPNPAVSGKGIDMLCQNGISVRTGVLEKQCAKINEFFNKRITTGLPFVVLKSASTFDGKIASRTGDSKWIGSERQRRYAHRLRKSVDAVVVGINTVLADDPRLEARGVGAKNCQPVPVIMDSDLRISAEAKVFRSHPQPIIATGREGVLDAKEKELQDLGAEILKIPLDAQGGVSAKALIQRLGSMGMCGVLVEGGSKVGASFLRQGLVDKVVFFYSPKIIGGDGISMIGDLGRESIQNALRLTNIEIKKFGDEMMVEGYL